VRRAVIDVGSNSVLLLVSELRGGEWVAVAEDTAITALGAGTKQTKLLSERGMSDTLAALAKFWRIAKENGATDILAGATMAARIATNAAEFLERAQAQSTPVVILTGEQEAQLGFEAIIGDPMFSDTDRISIVDPGGQSTEMVTASRVDGQWVVDFRRSYPVGTLGLKSTHFPEERVDGLTLLRATGALDDQIGVCYRPGQCGEVVVLGAAGTNLVSVRDVLTSWQPEVVHGARLEYEEISKAVGWMMPLSDAERREIPGVELGRENTIHLGAFILERFLFALRAEYCRVSVRGWRYALLANLDAFPL
jgi:exopolyphosphatase/guanosine-5'-triphosphate,3'-diphosphate pyrophosphatase